MKKSVAKKLSFILCLSLLGGSFGVTVTEVFASPVVSVASLQVGSSYQVYNSIPGYPDSASASRMSGSTVTYPAGTYSVFRVYNGMVNITKTAGYPGSWINPAQNDVPASEPAPAPAVTKTYMKTTYNLNMRSGAGTSYSLLKTIPTGTTVEVIGTSGSWKKVIYAGVTGWCSGSYLVATTVAAPTPPPVTAPAEGTYMKTTYNLNMRSGAGTSYSLLKTIPKGTTVEVVGTSGSWKKVVYAGITGWCSASYLVATTVAAPTPPPVVTPSEGAFMTTENLNLRSGAGSTYGILKVIPKGTKVDVLATSSYWKKVTYDGVTGWCSGNFLTAVAAPAEPVVTPPAPVDPPVVVDPVVTPPVEPPVTEEPPAPAPAPVSKKTTASLNLRSGAGTSHGIVAVIPAGTVVSILDVSGSWYKVSYGSVTGWCSGSYLTEVTAVYKTIGVPFYSQLYPTYAPVGCEPTSLFMALQYKGFAKNVTYKQFLDNMPKTSSNPEKGFVGSPYVKNDSLRTTIYPQPLTDYGNTYAGGRVANLTGATVDDIKKEILADNPVVVYLTVSRLAPVYANYNIEGQTQSLIKNNHAVLVTGYDSAKNSLRITDPWSKTGARNEYWVAIPGFATSYNLRHHAVAVR